MNLRHPFCKNPDCVTCLEDHVLLGDLLEYKIDKKDRFKYDWLCEYRKWCDLNLGFPAETPYGWAHPKCFENENINRFIREWMRIKD